MRRHGARGSSPGAIAYGLDSLRRKWPAVFGPSTVSEQRDPEGRLVRRSFSGLHALVNRWFVYQTGYAQGVFIDGWVTDRVFVAVPWDGRRSTLVIEGEVPAPGSHVPFEVEARTRGFRGGTTVANHGPFRVEVQLEQTLCEPHALELELRTSRFYEAPGDSRRPAFRLGSVGLQ